MADATPPDRAAAVPPPPGPARHAARPAAAAAPPDGVEASREVLAALHTAPAEPEPEPVPAPEQAPAAGVGSHERVELRPRSGLRRVVGLVLLGCLAATGVAAYLAWREPEAWRLGIAGVLALLSAVVWAVRAGSAPVRVALDGPVLEVVRGGRRERIDLRHAHVEMHGRPGERRWRTVVARPEGAPLVLDATSVHPEELTAELRRRRPDL